MIEKINLNSFNLVSNKILVKLDPNYDFVAIDGPNGTRVELQLINNNERYVDNLSISGIVLARADKIFFFDKSIPCSQQEFGSSMMASSQVNLSFDFVVGDKVYFNYNTHLNAEAENRLVRLDDNGICMLISIDSLFGYQKEDKIIPLNGYVFFKRDIDAEEKVLDSGIILLKKVKKYENLTAEVVAADKPVKEYLDGGRDSDVIINPGDRIIVDKRFGYRMAYDMHGGDLKSVEVCFRKHVLAVIKDGKLNPVA